MAAWLHGCKLVDANAYANNTRMRLAGYEIGTFHAAPAETEWDADDVRVYTDTRSRKGTPYLVVVKSHVEAKPQEQVGSYSRKPAQFPDLIESSIYGPRWYPVPPANCKAIGYHRKITYTEAHTICVAGAKQKNTKQSNKRKKRKEEREARNVGRRQVLFFIPTTNLAFHIGDMPRLILTRTYEEPFAPPAENVELQLPSTEAVIRWYRHTLDAPRGQMPRGFLVSKVVMSGLCQIEQYPIVYKVTIKIECLAQPQGKVFVVSLGGPLRTGPALLIGAPPVAGL
ncbi:hypothetical protein G5I_04794 [Acromyrmex echinatior]|uniref:Uncharacterized protein n=1 Tax=Acromyrmex echinatior TaxID=103372 RepID=F4WGL2_ACREC|nr:hypothetical protein G5I_04794 [Acromyrmex echinatior]